MEGFELNISFFDINGDQANVKVAKMGGGTVGKKYEGSWQVQIDGVYGLTEVRDYRNGTRKSHFDVAVEAYNFYLMDEGDE